jgi:CysZ protein
MIFTSAYQALRQILSPPFRAVLWKSLALTVAMLALMWLALTKLLDWWLASTTLVANYPWIDAYAVLLAGVGLVVGLGYLIPPVSMLVAGFFLDDVAEKVERESYPSDATGVAMPLGPSMLASARFALTMLGVNLIALLFLFIPGVNLVAFFVANSYLLGREYFTLAAGRHMPPAEAAAMRVRHSGTVLVAGAVIALLVIVPIANLLTPLFGTALMVHLTKKLNRARPLPRTPVVS